MALMISKIKKVKAWILLTLNQNLINPFGTSENCQKFPSKNVVTVELENKSFVDQANNLTEIVSITTNYFKGQTRFLGTATKPKPLLFSSS